MLPDDKYFLFDSYNNEYLLERIAYWESVPEGTDTLHVLRSLYREQERRVDEKLLAWVESK